MATAYFIYSYSRTDKPPSLEIGGKTGFIAIKGEKGVKYEKDDLGDMLGKPDSVTRKWNDAYFYSEKPLTAYDIVHKMLDPRDQTRKDPDGFKDIDKASEIMADFEFQLIHYNTEGKKFFLYPLGIYPEQLLTEQIVPELNKLSGDRDSNGNITAVSKNKINDALKAYTIPAYSPFIIFANRGYGTWDLKHITEKPTTYDYNISTRADGWHLSVWTPEQVKEITKLCPNAIKLIWMYQGPDATKEFGTNPVDLYDPKLDYGYMGWLKKDGVCTEKIVSLTDLEEEEKEEETEDIHPAVIVEEKEDVQPENTVEEAEEPAIPPVAIETDCNDGIDNDNDGKIDCFDIDCDGHTCNDGKQCSNYECKEEEYYKTRYIKVNFEGPEQIYNSTYSDLSAIKLQGNVLATVNLDPDYYSVWIRSKSTNPIKLEFLSNTFLVNPTSEMKWTFVDTYHLSDLELKTESTDALIDSIVFTNNQQWHPEDAKVVYKEVEEMTLGPKSINQINKNVWATSNDTAVWIGDTASAQLQLPSTETYYVWMREFNNGQRTLEAELNNGPANISPVFIHLWDWWYIGKVSGTNQLNVMLKNTGKYYGGGDVIVATTSSTWKPLSTQLDQLGVTPIPTDVKPEVLSTTNEKNIKSLLFLNPGTEKLSPTSLKSWSEHLWKIGMDGVMTISAEWFNERSDLIATTPAWKDAITFAKSKGLTSFFTKTAITYRNYGTPPLYNDFPLSDDAFLPDWFDDQEWTNQIERFKNIAIFTRDIGAQGVGIDMEWYSSTSAGHAPYDMAFLWDVKKWSETHTEQEVFNKVKERARATAEAMLAEYPNIEFMIYPVRTYSLYNGGTTDYGMLGSAWILGFLEANPVKRIILATEYHYLLTDPVGKTDIDSFVQELKKTEDMVKNSSFLSGKNFGFSHGIWPIDETPLIADDVFEKKLLAHFQESDSYVWFYSQHDAWKNDNYAQYFNILRKTK